jgi:hypothetical protein
MSELEDAWALALSEAEARARAAGHFDLSEYLALRTANDFLRTVGAAWLVNTFTAVAGEANRSGASLQMVIAEDHQFSIGNATMVGRQLSLEAGVRKLTIEVGWPRRPLDGFIRGGGLACANVKHFGRKLVSEELRLILAPEGVPRWIVQENDRDFREIHEDDVRRHLSILLSHQHRPSAHG